MTLSTLPPKSSSIFLYLLKGLMVVVSEQSNTRTYEVSLNLEVQDIVASESTVFTEVQSVSVVIVSIISTVHIF